MKRLLPLLLALLAVLIPVSAASGYVFDDAGLLTDSQIQALSDRGAEVYENHGFDLIIHTTEDFRQSGFNDVYEYARDLYLSAGFCENGSMLVLSMEDRDYCIIFSGDVGALAFTETGRDDLEQAVLKYFRTGDFAGGFRAYLDTCESYLTAYESGSPIGTGTDHSQEGYVPYHDSQSEPSPIFALIPGLIAAVITGAALSAPMHTAKEKRDAHGYDRDFHLTVRQDTFLHRTVTRTPKPQNNGNSGGGSGGSFHHSSGGSMSGRSGKF